MKKNNNILAISTFILLLTACIYESAVPIDKPGIKIDAKLLFKWEEQNSHDLYTITRLDDYSYKIMMYSHSTKKTDKMGAYCSVIDGTVFLNIWDMNKDMQSRKYKIVKMEWIDELSFKIYPLTENIKEQFKTSTELKEFIRSNMKDSYLYDEPALFKRIK